MAARVRAWREHPAGRFALRLFADQRRAVVARTTEPGGADDSASMTEPMSRATPSTAEIAADEVRREAAALGDVEHEEADGEPRREAAEVAADRDAGDDERDSEVQQQRDAEARLHRVDPAGAHREDRPRP